MLSCGLEELKHFLRKLGGVEFVGQFPEFIASIEKTRKLLWRHLARVHSSKQPITFLADASDLIGIGRDEFHLLQECLLDRWEVSFDRLERLLDGAHDI